MNTSNRSTIWSINAEQNVRYIIVHTRISAFSDKVNLTNLAKVPFKVRETSTDEASRFRNTLSAYTRVWITEIYNISNV